MTELGNASRTSASAMPHRGEVPGMAAPVPEKGTKPKSVTQSVTIALIAVLSVGFVLRCIAAFRLTPHVDEPSSMLAAHMVAERGLPILPSGTVYFQGYTLSLLLTPFIRLGYGGLDDLHVMRLLLVVAGSVAIYLCFRLALLLTNDVRIAMVMSTLVAIDPVCVQWSGHLRMYGLLQALTAGLAWAYLLLLDRGATLRRAAIVVALFWLAVFTHVGAALLGPAMALAALIVHGRRLWRMRPLLGTLALCALAPVTLLALNELLDGTRDGLTRGTGSGAGPTFVGSNLLAPLARVQVPPSEWDWASLVRGSNLFWLIPGLVVAISTIVGGRLLVRYSQATRANLMWVGAVMLLTFYWVPVIVVEVFTVSPKERYLLNVHQLGYLFVALLLVRLVGGRPATSGGLVRYAAAGLAILGISTALVWRLANPVVHPNYNAAMAYVVEQHEPGQPVIVALPPVGWLALGEGRREDLIFLAGPQDQSRARRYTKWDSDGTLVDYWVGADAIVSSSVLRVLLGEHPGAWVVVDDERMGADWAYAGSIEQTIRGIGTPVLHGPGGVTVYRPVSEADTN